MPKMCLVSAEDFRIHWQGIVDPSVPPLKWNGVEQRDGKERRHIARDRRYESSMGRRYRMADRRKGAR